MDVGFFPGNSDFENSARNWLINRKAKVFPNKSSKAAGRVTSLAKFISILQSGGGVTLPVGILFAVSHASDQGWMKVKLDDKADVDFQYEDLVKVEKRGTIKIPGSVLNPRPNDPQGNPIPATLIIHGCRIGSQAPFLQELKKALGGAITVVAPRYFDNVINFSDVKGQFEYLNYSFEVNSNKKIKDRAELITAFKKSSSPLYKFKQDGVQIFAYKYAVSTYTFYDGTEVPDAKWDEWVLKDISPGGERPVKMTVKLDPNIGKHKTLSSILKGKHPFAMAAFRHNVERFIEQVPINYAPGDPPTDKAQQIEDFKNVLLNHDNDHKFESSHPYPVYKRYGYASLDDMINGFDWVMKIKGKVMTVDGYRHQYICMPPVVDATNDTLLYTFYPDASASGLTQVIQVSEDDHQLFGSA